MAHESNLADVEARLNQAVELFSSRHFDEAINMINDVIALYPAISEAYFLRGSMYSEIGYLDQAIIDLSRAIELKSNDVIVYYNRGIVYDKMDRLTAALSDFESAVRIDPTFYRGFNNRGDIYYKMDNLDRALEDFSQAINLNPKYALAYNNRGKTYARLERFEEALRDFDLSLELEPLYSIGYYNRGVAYDKMGQLKKAAEDYKMVIELNPTFAPAHLNLGVIFRYYGLEDRALDSFKKAAQLGHPRAAIYANASEPDSTPVKKAPNWSTLDGWPHTLSSSDGYINIQSRESNNSGVERDKLISQLFSLLETLSNLNQSGLMGNDAISLAMKDFPELFAEGSCLVSITYLQSSATTPVYSWPDAKLSLHNDGVEPQIEQDVPFKEHKWKKIDLYDGNHGPVQNVGFDVKDILMMQSNNGQIYWLVLLEAFVFEQDNDAILQKLAVVEMTASNKYEVHEEDQVYENAGGGGPYDPMLQNLSGIKEISIDFLKLIDQHSIEEALRIVHSRLAMLVD